MLTSEIHFIGLSAFISSVTFPSSGRSGFFKVLYLTVKIPLFVNSILLINFKGSSLLIISASPLL